MTDTQHKAWPDRRYDILVPTTLICILSTLILGWRVVCDIKSKRKLMLCDYLLILAGIGIFSVTSICKHALIRTLQLMNIVATGIRFKTTHSGQGRHIQDPSIQKPHGLLVYSCYLWIGQVVNLLAVAILKYSICAYLLVLKFDRIYTTVVWLSILMVTAFNLIIPTLSVFCRTPFEANWNKSIHGKCFMQGGMGLIYAQGITNIITDVMYVVTPIIYLSTIQLPRRTQWGIRIVFMLDLVATLCSIMKTREMSALTKTKDPSWDATNLMIWSAVELSVGILVASLPPLRKQFDAIFRRILPTTFMGSKSKSHGGGAIPMYNVNKPCTIGSKPISKRSRDEDGESERHILNDVNDKPGQITKTVVHTIRSEEINTVEAPAPAKFQYGSNNV